MSRQRKPKKAKFRVGQVVKSSSRMDFTYCYDVIKERRLETYNTGETEWRYWLDGGQARYESQLRPLTKREAGRP